LNQAIKALFESQSRDQGKDQKCVTFDL